MTWKYSAVLNTGLTVLLNVAAGVLVGGFRLLPRDAYATVNAAVFKVFLPALICRGIGLKTDLYDDGIWRFIGAFLLLRVVALAIAVACAMLTPRQRRDLHLMPGRVVTDWLGLSWISTVILGVPVLRSAMGDQFAKFGILAGISSFVFQLPLMLVLLEVHRWLSMSLPSTQQDAQHAYGKTRSTGSDLMGGMHMHSRAAPSATEDSTVTTGTCARPLPPLPSAAAPTPMLSSTVAATPFAPSVPDPTGAPPTGPAGGLTGKSNIESAPLDSDDASGRGGAEAGNSPVRAGASRLARGLLSNHVLWGITLGFVLSLSKIGTKWLDPGPGAVVVNGKAVYKPNEDFVEELGFIDQILEWLGRCTTPAALFAMGLWIPSQWQAFWGASTARHHGCAKDGETVPLVPPPSSLLDTALHWAKVVWMLGFKLVLCPLIMLGLAKALDLDDPTSRAAVLVATIPISLASFTLAETFGVGEALLTKLVVLGTLLMLPATVLWLEVLDSTDTFVVPSPPPTPSAAGGGALAS
eukprot:jgi/Ulvmu1/11406/UM075_0068.1